MRLIDGSPEPSTARFISASAEHGVRCAFAPNAR
jgi:hypothetical protein